MTVPTSKVWRWTAVVRIRQLAHDWFLSRGRTVFWVSGTLGAFWPLDGLSINHLFWSCTVNCGEGPLVFDISRCFSTHSFSNCNFSAINYENCIKVPSNIQTWNHVHVKYLLPCYLFVKYSIKLICTCNNIWIDMLTYGLVGKVLIVGGLHSQDHFCVYTQFYVFQIQMNINIYLNSIYCCLPTSASKWYLMDVKVPNQEHSALPQTSNIGIPCTSMLQPIIITRAW